MKHSVFVNKGQKGFTLLELLVVVAIIAILSVGAILAYDGLTDKAQSATAANNNISADQAIRNYRVISGNYPNQWDHLVADNATADPFEFFAEETYEKLGKVDVGALSSTIAEALDEVGIEELQAREVTTAQTGVEPNLQHSEGAANDGNTVEIEIEDGDFPTQLVVLPSANSAGAVCQINGTAITDINGGAIAPAAAAAAQNFAIQVNDNLGEDECHLILAFGFGHDAAHSTVASNAAIAAAPAFVSKDINPGDNYARYIALFDVGVDADENGSIVASEIYNKARLVGLITPDGRTIDESQAAANDETQQN